jgi:hypothetical protein
VFTRLPSCVYLCAARCKILFSYGAVVNLFGAVILQTAYVSKKRYQEEHSDNCQKGEKVYLVAEFGKTWRLSRTLGGLSVRYSVDKRLAPTLEELEKYVADNDAF